MNRIITGFIMAAVVAVLVAGCIGTGGQSAPPPNNVTPVAKDTRVVLTWDMVDGVEYWLYAASGTGVTPENCSTMPSCSTTIKATSPASVSGLNGTEYSFSINGRTSGGPGGSGSVAVSATPRPAGATWTSDDAPTTSNLLGIAYGAYDSNGSRFVAAGTAGALYSGTVYTHVGASGATTGITWSQLSNPLGTTFNAVNYDTTRGKYISVGAGGGIIAMTPSSSNTWSPQTSNTSSDLYAVANSGANNTTVATGALGTIVYTADGGTTWVDKTSGSGTTNALYGVTYGYSYTSTDARYIFVAVGASRTLIYSKDFGLTWLPGTCSTCTGTPDLKGVTYGGKDSNGYGIFVAVGASGTVLTSEDGINWTPQLTATTTILTSSNLNAITYSTARRFVAVADDGYIYYSNYYASGSTTEGNGARVWSQVTPAPLVPLYAVTTGGLFDFSAVGQSGANQYAD